MLISPELNAAINEEIGREFFASNQYVAIASYFDDRALRLLSKMYLKQADEERMHALKFVTYLNDVGGKVEIPAIDAPKATFGTAEEALQLALDWELKVTQFINDLMTLAISQKDYAAMDFLKWFVTEQVEEVHSAEDILKIAQAATERNIIMVEAYLVHQD